MNYFDRSADDYISSLEIIIFVTDRIFTKNLKNSSIFISLFRKHFGSLNFFVDLDFPGKNSSSKMFKIGHIKSKSFNCS